MHGTSWEMLDWMNHKLKSRLPGEISPTSDMEMILMKNLDRIIKSRHLFADKGAWFFNSHVQMWELDYKESWALSNWCFWPVVLEKTLEAPLDCKEIKPVNPKGNQSWILEGLMLKLKLWYFGHLMQRPDSLGKTLMLGKIEGTREGDCRGWDGWMASLT